MIAFAGRCVRFSSKKYREIMSKKQESSMVQTSWAVSTKERGKASMVAKTLIVKCRLWSWVSTLWRNTQSVGKLSRHDNTFEGRSRQIIETTSHWNKPRQGDYIKKQAVQRNTDRGCFWTPATAHDDDVMLVRFSVSLFPQDDANKRCAE